MNLIASSKTSSSGNVGTMIDIGPSSVLPSGGAIIGISRTSSRASSDGWSRGVSVESMVCSSTFDSEVIVSSFSSYVPYSWYILHCCH